jgi:signal transduction histidine kinase
MKAYAKLLIFLLLPVFSAAQNTSPEKLKDSLKMAKTDSLRFELLDRLVRYYYEGNRETCVQYLDQSIVLAKRNGKMVDLAYNLNNKGYELTHLRKFPEAFSCLQEAKRLAEDPANENNFWPSRYLIQKVNLRLLILADIHNDLGHLMGYTGDTIQQIAEYRQILAITGKAGWPPMVGVAYMNLGNVYRELGKLDSALLLSGKAVAVYERTGFKNYLGSTYEDIAQVYRKKGDHALELLYYRKAESINIAQNNLTALSNSYLDLSKYYLTLNNTDSSLFYAKKALTVMQSIGIKDKSGAYERLYKSYRLNHRADSVTKYLGLALAAKDSSYDAMVKSLNDFQKLSFKTQNRLNDLEKQKELIRSRTRTYSLLSAIVFLLMIAFFFYRNNRQKQKANHLLSDQKEEIEAQRDQLGSALEILKTTQNQLIQAEKMASLGELTAGIAHEIQNPLNFVNNFSEVSAELIDELDEELNRGDIEEAKAVASDVKQNLEKIRHHGKRADSIVKGMLEHSRVSSGQKEPTDLNTLTDEYLRLAYHGLRAKDKNFNTELVTNFDQNLPSVEVIPQDISRVLLNLFNNAFYAVNQKEKTVGNGYKPVVEVSTTRQNGSVVIKVKDNGTGIPDAVKDKIMQPFFTTKPTGEGTGLGLSLSYDIVVKGHGGSINIDTKENEFTEFKIALPLKTLDGAIIYSKE